MRSEEKRLVDVKEEVKSEDNKLKQVVKHFVKVRLFNLFQLKKQMVERMAERERLERQVQDHIHHHHSLRQSSSFKFSQTKDYQHLFFSR